MSRFIRLDIELTDKTAPKITTIDPIESDGSIFLWDAAKAALSAVPAHRAQVPNMLADLGLATTGVATHFVFNKSATIPANALFTEITHKSGIHILPSQVNQTANEQAAYLASNSALTQWLINHPPGKRFVSIWMRPTRAAIAQGVNTSTFNFAMNATNFEWYLNNGAGGISGGVGSDPSTASQSPDIRRRRNGSPIKQLPGPGR